ncbi:MAG: DUF512 domain-containing protein [Lachnospiraceae bacterium]|nr:DUF512 domain-containing protein [Lachnospiraceae bacterium]
MKNIKHVVKSVLPDSIAQEMDIEPKDVIISINDQPIEDVFDYHYLVNDEYLEVLVEKPDGEQWLLEIEKEFEEDLGIEFENSLMDEYRSCSNHCVFCFIDQMPPNMRKTLYFKDDDSRLSFLQGNYVTLTNMSDHDIDRIIHYHLAPINISFHTTNPELRKKMLNNRFAGDIFPRVQRLYEAGIEMNGQIVLCKGLNDGEELEKSIRDLSKYLPYLKSVSVVPVGLSKYREGLYPLEAFQKEDAVQVIKTIEAWQDKLMAEYNIHFIHASDEWYLLAERDLPQRERYDNYLQLENGVGMLRLLEDEITEALNHKKSDERVRKITIATGKLASGSLNKYNKAIRDKFPGVNIQVIPIENQFFGTQITVSGLITGTDLKQQLEGQELGEQLLLPCNMLRSGEEVFLDDVTVDELEEFLHTSIMVVDSSGQDYVDAVLGDVKESTHRRRQIYEQTNSSNCGKTECR